MAKYVWIVRQRDENREYDNAIVKVYNTFKLAQAECLRCRKKYELGLQGTLNTSTMLDCEAEWPDDLDFTQWYYVECFEIKEK